MKYLNWRLLALLVVAGVVLCASLWLAPQPASAWGEPNAPSNLALNPPHTVSGTLSWSDNSSNETRFEIWRLVTAPPAHEELVAIRGSNTTSHQVTAPYPYTSYYTIYTVKACNAYGCSESSGLATYVDLSTPTPTPTPSPTSTPTCLWGDYTYEPNTWDYPLSRREDNNCYNYAIDEILSSPTDLSAGKTWNNNIVGTVYPDPYDDEDYYEYNSLQHITALNWYRFALLDGFDFVGLDIDDAEPGTRLVALGGQPGNGDFHFVRLDSNCDWSQKRGEEMVNNTRGGEPLDPEYEATRYGMYFVGYFEAP